MIDLNLIKYILHFLFYLHNKLKFKIKLQFNAFYNYPSLKDLFIKLLFTIK